MQAFMQKKHSDITDMLSMCRQKKKMFRETCKPSATQKRVVDNK